MVHGVNTQVLIYRTTTTNSSVAPGRASLSVDPHYLLMYQDHENHHHRLNHSKENRLTPQNVHHHPHKSNYGVRYSHNGKLMRARSLEGYKSSLNTNPNPNPSTGRSGSLSPKTLQRKKHDTLKASSRQMRSDGGSYGWRAKSNNYNSLERSSSYSNMMRVAPVLNVPNMVTIRSSSSSKNMGMQNTSGSLNKEYHHNPNPNPNPNHPQQSVNGGSSVSYGGGFAAGLLANLFSTSSSSIKGISKSFYSHSYPSTTTTTTTTTPPKATKPKPKPKQTTKSSGSSTKSSSSMNNRSSRSSSSSFSSFNSSSSNNSSTSESSHASSATSNSIPSCKVLLPTGIRSSSRRRRNSPPP